MSTVRCYNDILPTNVAKCLLRCYDTIKAENWLRLSRLDKWQCCQKTAVPELVPANIA